MQKDMLMRQYVAVSVMAQDQVGIIHAVSRTISAMDGDIEDLSQTVLRGYFTMILIASLPADTAPDALVAALDETRTAQGYDWAVGVKPLDGLPPVRTVDDQRDVYVLTASGKDRIGFVASVTGFCADNGLNILDLDTRAVGENYIMLLQVDLSGVSPRQVQSQLAAFSAEKGLQTTLQHDDVFQATQELRMP